MSSDLNSLKSARDVLTISLAAAEAGVRVLAEQVQYHVDRADQLRSQQQQEQDKADHINHQLAALDLAIKNRAPAPAE